MLLLVKAAGEDVKFHCTLLTSTMKVTVKDTHTNSIGRHAKSLNACTQLDT